MPIAQDPTERFTVWLASDADTPEASRPSFEFRYLTGRKSRRWRQMMEPGYAPANLGQELYSELASQLAGWRNQSDAVFEPAKLDELITDAEAWELLARASHNIGSDELKKSERPSPTPSAESAPATAPVAGGDGR